MFKLSIRASLIAILSAIGLLVAVFSFVSIESLDRVQGITSNVVNDVFPSVSAVKDIKVELVAMKLGYFQYLAALTPDATRTAEKQLTDARLQIEKAIEVYTPYVDTELEQNLLKQFNDSLKDYIAAGDKMIVLSKVGNFQQAGSMLESMGPIVSPAQSALEDLLASSRDQVKAATDLMHSTSATVTLVIFALIGIVALLILGATIYVLRSIAKPIRAITDSMIVLSRGDTDREIPYARRKDEVGQMAGAVEIFRAAALTNRRLQAEAEAMRLAQEAERESVLAEAESAAQARLKQATSGLASGLRRLAAGDLSFHLDVPFAQDFEALRHDLNAAVSQLNTTLAAVAEATDLIDNGSREVSHSADDLARRTEQQAASLEQTAAALDEITVNVSNASRRTEEARNVAAKANQSAAQSGAVVANAINAMGRIEQSSNQISSIIGVIDEIAFQTNLLALNAGVEAARAGEAGRGFAVVAQEVRELAQRSAKAAKEIKELIRNSTTEVENGVKLVSDTGEALKAIGDYVITINDHMDSIATSAREQSTGLAEVNTAINRMDQVTQQNAAMVEETNAAGATLAQESVNLRSIIAQFKLQSTVGYQGQRAA